MCSERAAPLPLRSPSDPGANLYDKRGLLVKLEVEVSKTGWALRSRA